ncbi:hypothetical protein NUU61_003178 [Penicillium alfredii]|uniref:F-box domain-containing protein n=1 Tax=Penicillium alfredii TaxID=1506179 RepID=A0A9W9FSW1_9EURO|nr:uncharacterized protein NUU61_003178 [Penicillium alfredii]KAJ5105831.1 hypothetical protein NUU61_003178 [Penicillium alfredii]
MQPSEQPDGINSHSPSLPSFPVELLIEIFGFLPSFPTVFALAATCHQLRRIWLENAVVIYPHLAARSIPCETHARQFLADQDFSVGRSSQLSALGVRRMIRNAHIIEKAIQQFEKEVVCKVKTGGLPAAPFYGKGQGHPPFLTRSERRRFIRTYYQLWGMLKLDHAESQRRLESMTVKQLYHLCEMCRLPQSIGHEEVLPAEAEGKNLENTHLVERGRPPDRDVLLERAWHCLEQTYVRVHDEDADEPWLEAKYEGYLWWIVIWDHWQPSLKALALCHRGMGPPTRLDIEKELWDESSDEEVYMDGEGIGKI